MSSASRQCLRIESMHHTFLLQIEHEQKGTDALVAVGERMILDDEVQEMCRFLLTRVI